MTKIRQSTFASIALLSLFVMTACGGVEEELSKKIGEVEVSISGEHSDMLSVTDSVKVLLTNPSGSKDGWEVHLIIPMENTSKWEDFALKENYDPSMGNLEVELVNENDAELDYDLSPDWGAVKALLSANASKEENVVAKPSYSWDGKKYKEAKEIFDKVAGVHISKADLSRIYHASASSSSSSSSSSDDWDDDDLDKAIDASKKMIDAASKAAKATNYRSAKKALDAYEEALDALDDWDD